MAFTPAKFMSEAQSFANILNSYPTIAWGTDVKGLSLKCRSCGASKFFYDVPVLEMEITKIRSFLEKHRHTKEEYKQEIKGRRQKYLSTRKYNAP